MIYEGSLLNHELVYIQMVRSAGLETLIYMVEK